MFTKLGEWIFQLQVWHFWTKINDKTFSQFSDSPKFSEPHFPEPPFPPSHIVTDK